MLSVAGRCAAAGRGAAAKARAVPAGCCSSLSGRPGCQHRRQPSSPISSSRLGLSFMPSGAEFKLLQPIVEMSGGTAPMAAFQHICPNISSRRQSAEFHCVTPQASRTTLTTESSATTSLLPAGSSLPRSCGNTAKVRFPLYLEHIWTIFSQIFFPFAFRCFLINSLHAASIMAGGSHMNAGFNSIKLENPAYYCNSYTPPGPADHHGMLSSSGYSE